MHMEVWPFLEHNVVSIPLRLTYPPHPHRQKAGIGEPPRHPVTGLFREKHIYHITPRMITSI